MNKIKRPSPYNHNIEPAGVKRPNYALRRLVAGIALTGALLGGAKAVQGMGETLRGPDFSVDLEEVSTLTPEERIERYEEITAQSGDTLDKLARNYVDQHDLDVDYRRVVSALSAQGDTSVINPGDTFYLPRQDSGESE